MELNEQQKESIKKWAAEGCKLSEIQKRLKEEFDLSMTFMDLRFAVLDLDVSIKDNERKPDPKPEQDAFDNEPGAGQMDENTGIGGGSVNVTIDRVKKPGVLVSGTVTFSDGVNASWSLDQMGRLALNADTPGYRPSDQDLQEFQTELQAQIQQKGF